MVIGHKRTLTVQEEYQLEENDPETGYEYIEGLVFAMAG
jgi:hypothetical protein